MRSRGPTSRPTSPVPPNLSRPRVPPAFVPRPRLIQLLDAGNERPVTLVSAGAGWGKTLLVASWAGAAARQEPVGWLSLDNDDNDPAVFWSHVLSALRHAGAIQDVRDLREVGPGSSMNQAFIRRVAGGLARLPQQVTLVLDDLDEIHEPRVMKDLSMLLRCQPEQLRLVLVARTDPVLPLHRMRAAGDLTEIRAADLQFTAAEATELLSHHGLQLDDRELRVLLDRTEGWAAGLRLAAIFLTSAGDHHRIEDFAGDKGAVADYLVGEVLAQQPPDLHRFLLYTSIVDKLSGELADAITNGGHGQRILEQLERTNVFLVGLGSRPGWFRYHHLFRDLLRHQLLLDAPEMIPVLHYRAVEWYLSHDAPVKALAHAAAAEDWPLVGRLVVARGGPLILSVDREALVNVLERVPPEWFGVTAELTMCAALLMFHARGYDAVLTLVAKARKLLAGRSAIDRRPVEIGLRMLEVAVARQRSDMPALMDATSEALDWLTAVRWTHLPSALKYRAIGLNNKGVALLWTGQLESANRYLWSAMTAARATGVELVEINSLGHLALIDALRGSLRDADGHALEGRELAERRGWSSELQAVPVYLALASIALERNDIPEAQWALRRGFNAYRTDPEAAQYVGLRIAQARMLLAHAQPEAARAMLDQARREAERVLTAPTLAWQLALALAEVDLVAGHADRFLEEIGAVPDGTDFAARNQVWLARAALASGNQRSVEPLLAPVLDAPADPLTAVDAWITAALVAESQRQGNRSLEALTRAFAIAEPEGLRRPFLTTGRREIVGLVERQVLLVEENAQFVADVLADLRPGAPRADRAALNVELSERELEVLRYLPTMFNAGEIAEDLHVSVNTVKAHLRAIYRKLGVSRRQDAVGQAQKLRIL
ncbi:MAG: helix-turn-helix transcriptional regulator [Actinobacteria bacterium]|nr:MAG: helix-turn-helix transcriptional regulator [Actinomycetota bacterium]